MTGGFSQQCGLGAIASELGVEFTPHRAVDDAYATMRVCEAMCGREQTDVKGIASKYKIRAGRTEEGKTYAADSAGLRDRKSVV